MLNHVICDIDGVLLDLTHEEEDCFVRAIEFCTGAGGINRDWSTYSTRNDVGIISEVLESVKSRKPTHYEVEQIVGHYAEYIAELLQEKKGLPRTKNNIVNGLVDLARRCRTSFSIATANARQVAEMRISSACLPFGFEVCGCAEDGATKTEILEHVLAELQDRLHPYTDTKIIYLGDNSVDLDAANTSGIPFLGLAQDRKSASQFRKEGAEWVCGSTVCPGDLASAIVEAW